MSNALILGQNLEYSLDCFETQLNNNVLIVGSPGTGKTRSLVTPNLLEATGSYIVSDPKGTLHKQYSGYLKGKGYTVKCLDFTNPLKSHGYNFFRYIHDEQDIVKIANMLIYTDEASVQAPDPFWNQAACLLLQAIIGFLWEATKEDSQNLESVLKLLDACNAIGDMTETESVADRIFADLEKKNPDSWALRTYKRFRVAANRTLRSILIVAHAQLARFDTPQLRKMLFWDELNIASVGDKKTAIFVVASDSDRSLDDLVNVFFTQAMNELVNHADRDFEDGRLPVPVRFIMDDFATNCAIHDFPKMITSIRSRGISTMLMIQAESQLARMYGQDGKTIIASCDSYVYMGGNDIETCRSVAERCDVPMKKILNMPVGYSWIFRRGQEPIFQKNLDLEEYLSSIHFERSVHRPLTEHEMVIFDEAEIPYDEAFLVQERWDREFEEEEQLELLWDEDTPA